jgi:hypothetical protein
MTWQQVNEWRGETFVYIVYKVVCGLQAVLEISTYENYFNNELKDIFICAICS